MTGHTPWSEIKHKATPDELAEARERRIPKATYVMTVHTKKRVGIGDGRLRDEFLNEIAENITDLLPDGWWLEIHEWNDPREGDDDE